MGAPFLIFALPRSRTTWLSRFLTYGVHYCGHDELRHCRSLDDVKTWFDQPFIGSAETAAAPFWRLLPKVAPDAKIVVIRRPVEEVVQSLPAVHGLTFDEGVLRKSIVALDRKLDQIERRLSCMSIRFEDLAKEETCKAVFEYCLPYSFDREHWQHWDAINVQCNLPQMYRHFAAYRKTLDKLASAAKHRILADFATREPVSPDGVTLQTEDFETWVKDAIPLFQQHLIDVGEDPENWRTKNIPLMRSIYGLGSMQIMTARCNGRMFGYLMTVIAPSLESEGLSAVHTTFYASPEFKGLGMKLQRAALRALAERGVGEVHFQAGVRGSGERTETIYRRMGAEYGGKVFRLKLAEAA